MIQWLGGGKHRKERCKSLDGAENLHLCIISPSVLGLLFFHLLDARFHHLSAPLQPTESFGGDTPTN